MGTVLNPSGRARSSVFYGYNGYNGWKSHFYTETCFFRSYRGAEERNKWHFPPWLTEEG